MGAPPTAIVSTRSTSVTGMMFRSTWLPAPVGPKIDAVFDDVADLALGLMLATSRQIVAAHKFIEAGEWAAGGFPSR